MVSLRSVSFVLCMLMASVGAGCLDAEKSAPETAMPVRFGTGEVPPDAIHESGQTTSTETRTFEGSFGQDTRATEFVGSFTGTAATKTFTIVDAPRAGVPVTVDLTLRYTREDPAVPGLEQGSLTLDLDVALPPLAPMETTVEGDEVHLVASFVPAGPVVAVVTHHFPDPAEADPLTFALGAVVTSHFDAAPAGVPLLVDVDPTVAVPVLKTDLRRADYVLFGPDGAFLGKWPIDGALRLAADDPAGTYAVMMLQPGARLLDGPPASVQVLSADDAAFGVRGAPWEASGVLAVPMGPDGRVEASFDTVEHAWVFEVAVEGTFNSVAEYRWALLRDGAVLHEEVCGCSYSADGRVLGHVSIRDASLHPHTYGVEAEGLYGGPELVVVAYAPMR